MSSPQQQAPPQAASPPASPQAVQAGIAVLVGLAIARLWPHLDLTNLRESLPAFKAAVAVDVQRHAAAAAAEAARQYKAQRIAAGVGAGFTPVPADPPPLAQIAQAVDWAVGPLWDSAVALQALDAAPAETAEVASSAIADAKARLAAAAEKLVLDAGHDTIVDNVGRDRKAKGWARIAEPGCCSFCAMLASRGAVYSSEKSADFRAHDHDRCHVEPVWNAYEPSAQIRQWQQLYTDTAKQIGYGRAGGASADDMRVAFRQAFEGRPIDLERSRKMRAAGTGNAAPSRPSPARSGSAAPSRPSPARPEDMIRAELTALEQNLPRLSTDQQRQWTQTRIDALRQQLDQQ